jgi:glycosyltransferase involved in cell wall biosynthesis
VQWLWAKETSRQYHLPFFLVEAVGVRLHRRYVAVSGAVARELRRRNAAAQVDVVHAGVATDLATSSPRVASRPPEVVFLGRVQVHAKGIDLLLNAFAKIASNCDANLVLAGDGPDVAALRELVTSLSLGNRVRMIPWVPDTEKAAVLGAAQIVALPSRYETFGLVALEAMALGRPVVGFGIPALREIVPSDCGTLVEPFDADAFGDALLALLSDPKLCESMGERGQEHARKFSWDASAFAQESAYLAAVAAGRRRVGRRWRR